MALTTGPRPTPRALAVSGSSSPAAGSYIPQSKMHLGSHAISVPHPSRAASFHKRSEIKCSEITSAGSVGSSNQARPSSNGPASPIKRSGPVIFAGLSVRDCAVVPFVLMAMEAAFRIGRRRVPKLSICAPEILE